MQAGAVLDGRYRLIEPVGTGGFGQVWKAHDPKVDRTVAVKVLTGVGGLEGSRQVARFAREAAVAGGLSHPSIVTIHDFGSALHDGQMFAYPVMEFLPGKSLSTALEAGRLGMGKTLTTASCVTDALDAAHRAGLTHRDIKPSNIMLLPGGPAKVVDFGITKGSDDRHDITATGILIGTPAYMAPECFSGTFDHRSDLYSLGCALYEMLTGRRPFDGTSWHLVHQHLHEQPPPLLSLRPDTPTELNDLVTRLLAKDPSDCPPSAEEVWAIICDIGDRHFSQAPPCRGQDIASEVRLSRDEAADGTVIVLRIVGRKPCLDCEATRAGVQNPAGCSACDGAGEIEEKRSVKVRIPAGVREGQQLRLKGLGAPGTNGGPAGNLYVTVQVDR
ncbi:protein kinase [Streptomyces sp. NPDC127074]|uniref:protein kinase domain-containing protein n=1 Tax=Streptomyces sp. NPDC127074 TaxID=3347130 RepID=UPI00366846DA